MLAQHYVRTAVLTCALFAALPALAFNDCDTPQTATTSTESIACSTPRPNTVVWRIDRPNVTQRQTTYPNILFAQGDLVSVFAGGCVQHGGTGLTWKRYVNPMTPEKNNDDSHHGLITVPGHSTLGPIRDAVLSGGIAILTDPGPAAALSLGYADDGYGDNGYSARDDGWWEQCKDLSDAWVVIAIQHNCAASSAPECIRGRALDIVADARDPNGFPINPNWAWTRLVGTAPPVSDVCGWSNKIGGFPVDDASLCVTQSTRRDNYWVCVQGGTSGGIAGHMNWMETAVAYQGWIWWASHDYFWDDDYTLNMASLDEKGNVSGSLFVANQSNPQVEFSSDETIDHFTGIPWWQGLHLAVDTEDKVKYRGLAVAAGSPMPQDSFPPGTEAIVIGQLGTDCAHSCNSEVHPVWGIFVHTKADPKDDTWAFFVRNWGNEGYCSTNDYRLLTTQMTVRLPAPFTSNDVEQLPQTIVGMTRPTAPYRVALDTDRKSALATFALPSPDQHGVVFGELHLRWQRDLSSVESQVVVIDHTKAEASRQSFMNRAESTRPRNEAAEEYLTRLFKASGTFSSQSQRLVRKPTPPAPLRRLSGRVVSTPPPRSSAKVIIKISPAARKDDVSVQREKTAQALIKPR